MGIEYEAPAQEITNIFTFLQIHSLTARSVPRQFREDLRKDLPLDKNIRIPAPQKSSTTEAPSSENECHIIYDSQHHDQVPYPEAEFIRTPSPEHTGIPAGPVKMPPIRSWQSNASIMAQNQVVGYTSDDSNSSTNHELVPVKPLRRKVTKQNSNPSVKSLVERYNC